MTGLVGWPQGFAYMHYWVAPYEILALPKLVLGPEPAVPSGGNSCQLSPVPTVRVVPGACHPVGDGPLARGTGVCSPSWTTFGQPVTAPKGLRLGGSTELYHVVG